MPPTVCLVIFRRPEHTKRVAESIAKSKPSKLMVFADGPRADCPDDIRACAEAREMIDRVDWDCEVVKNYSDVNLGCGLGPATAFNWVFQQSEEAIILEDDCLPHPTFFKFCEELLERYRNDQRVMHINGCTYRRGDLRNPASYYFCNDIGCWGWATWRRAWRKFDIAVNAWGELRNSRFLHEVIDCDHFEDHYKPALDAAYHNQGEVNYWDYQWAFACWVNSGLAIYPNHNLVTNLGWGPDATHTVDPNSPVANLPVREMRFPLIHPAIMYPKREIDRQGWHDPIPGVQPMGFGRILTRRVARLAPQPLRNFYRQCRAYLR